MLSHLEPSAATRAGLVPDPRKLRWIVAQEGTRQSYAVPIAFNRLGLLRTFYADIWCRRGRSLLRRGPAGARALATHFNAELPSDRVVSFNPAAIADRIGHHFRRGHWSPTQQSERYCRFGEWYATRVRNHLEQQELTPGIDSFFGFNTNCLETLELLRNRRILTIVDQVDPGVIEEEMMIEETERWPGWAKLPGRMSKSYWDRIKAEWEIADIVLVNSEWSLEALVQQGVPREKIIVVPLAIDLANGHVMQMVRADGNLKVLWLGSVILRKGIQYLVEAARRLQNQNIEFLLAGPLGVSETAVRSFPSNMKLLGRITRDQLGEVYRQAQVFVLPTISDGFAITQLEAMAHGLPVVTTPNCGRVVTDGVDGFIVPARNSEALADALARLNDDRWLLRTMSHHAMLKVQKYDLPSNARMIQDLVIARCKRLQEKELVGHD
jgi:glycosyltransferase involved in cell wall biosynthesis